MPTGLVYDVRDQYMQLPVIEMNEQNSLPKYICID
jgi:hypothetical protein